MLSRACPAAITGVGSSCGPLERHQRFDLNLPLPRVIKRHQYRGGTFRRPKSCVAEQRKQEDLTWTTRSSDFWAPPQGVLHTNSYADLLKPVPNAGPILQAIDQEDGTAGGRAKLQPMQYHHHHRTVVIKRQHHHHHLCHHHHY